MLERDGLDLTYSDSQIFRNGVPAGRAFEHEPQHPPVTFEKLLKEECCVMTSAVVASRQAMIDAGLFDERFRRCEDFDLWLRMSFRGGRMDYHPGVGIEHRLLPGGLSSDGYLLKQGRIEIYKKTLDTLSLSASQRELIRDLIAITEGKGQMDMVKRCCARAGMKKRQPLPNVPRFCCRIVRAAGRHGLYAPCPGSSVAILDFGKASPRRESASGTLVPTVI